MVTASSFLVALLAVSIQLCSPVYAAPETTLNITAFSPEVESDWTTVYYPSHRDAKPLLVANDGGAENGGLHIYDFDVESPLPEVKALPVGRTKTLTVAHDVGGKDLAITIAMPDSIIRVYELPELKKAAVETKLLGDWSAMCSWKSHSRNQYFYLFGKGKAVQYLIRPAGQDFEMVEIQTFSLPFEVSGCAVSEKESLMFIHGDDTTEVHVFPLKESTSSSVLSLAGEALHDVTGIAVYHTKKHEKDFLLVAQADVISIYEVGTDITGTLQGTIELSGHEDIEVFGLGILQAPAKGYPQGAITFGIETDEREGHGIASLDGIFDDLSLELNTKYDPRARAGCLQKSPITEYCSNSGYFQKTARSCECFAGFKGKKCESFTCGNNCSGSGKCIGANVCQCKKGWGGINCSFLLVEPNYETDPNGGDGDDPAIWVHPKDPEQSRIITTVKSERGAGLGVFDLKGNLLQHLEAPKPNNVDMIYDFNLGSRKVDLAFAACRTDDTLCLFEMLSNGTLTSIPGGSQLTVDDYTVYGSCVYRSPKTNKQYLFVNEKSARYLQYELTATKDGVLETTLVRDFQGGNGGQVEGCVVDDENGWLFLGEEPSALWRYGAEPDSPDSDRVLIAEVGDGKLYGDVEGVTLVPGSTPDKGFIIVSCQGVSAYNVYRRNYPHEYVTTFTLTTSADGEIDAVTNTDGVTAVGKRLGKEWPYGMLVVHDDTNQLPDGTTSPDASFKIVGLDRVLGAEGIKKLGLLKEIDTEWDPRAGTKEERSLTL